MKKLIRFAPSPTGLIHIGNIKILLFQILKFKNHFLLIRIDDTNENTYNIKYLKNIINIIKFLKIKFKKLIIQTNRLYRYIEVSQYNIKKKFSFFSYNNIKKLIYKKIYKNLNKNLKIKFKKILNFKKFKFKLIIKFFNFKNKLNNNFENFITIKSNGIPTYNFSSVIDDIDMNINNIVRGIEHLNNLKQQINILIILKKTFPNYLHLPIILNNDGSKLSKKKNIFNILKYKKNFFLKESLIIYILNIDFKRLNFLTLKNLKIKISNNYLKKSYIKYEEKKLIYINKILIKITKFNILYNKIKIIIIKKFKKKIFLKNKKLLIIYYKKYYTNIINLFNILIKVNRNNFINVKIIKKIFKKKFFIYLLKLKRIIKNKKDYNNNKILKLLKIIVLGKENITKTKSLIKITKNFLIIKKINILIKIIKLIVPFV